MFTRSITIFRLLGFEIKVDFTWIIIAILITWQLATSYFPAREPDLQPYVYWALGVEGALGIFLSIIVHELGHAVVARRYGIPIKDITLFIFGGVANMEEEPKRPRDEFFMAIAGPVTSGLIALAMLAIEEIVGSMAPAAPVLSVLAYLSWMNALLAGFNMIPAFPLDGGRVLRAILWDWRKDLRLATRISAGLGSAFGLALIFLGVFAFMSGDTFAGLWWFMIGMFVRSASAMSYRQMMLRRALEGEPISRFMKTEVVSVQPNVTLREFVERFVYEHHHKLYPVMVAGRLIGCVTTRGVKAVPADRWAETSVGEITEACTPENSVPPQTDAMQALSLMNRTGRGRLLVVESGELLGIVALKDLMTFLGLKLDLEGKS
jgi:Zn-dependent protease